MSDKKQKKQLTPSLCDVIDTVVVTEKSYVVGELNKYIFKVSPTANKLSVKDAVEALFGVSVTGVNIINSKGKTKVFRGKKGRRKDVKKAIVTLAEGDKIDVAAGI